MNPLRLHPTNPRWLELAGRPLALITATEHYGAVLNRPFNASRYLRDAAAHGLTLTRLFTLFRELQSAQNPYSTCKPESTDYLAPWRRVGPGTALDGQPVYDLDQPNPEFFDRLQAFLTLAEALGIVVEVVLFSNTYAPDIWALNPLHARNNLNDLEDAPWTDYLTQRHPRRFARQVQHAQAIVAACRDRANVLFEICNEPGGGFPGSDQHPQPDEVDAWQRAIRQVIAEAEADLPTPHLVAGQQAFRYEPWEQGNDGSFDDAGLGLDVINTHPLPGTTHRGQTYDLGPFMQGRLNLATLRDFCLAVGAEGRPVNLDEDNSATQYRDPRGWTLHRKRAWMALFCGCHYDMIDFTIWPGREQGTPEAQAGLRAPFGHLARFIHGLDLARAHPAPERLLSSPEHTVAGLLAVDDGEVAVYLANAREWDKPGLGDPIVGTLRLNLPARPYRVTCLSPLSGLRSVGLTIAGGPDTCLDVPAFEQDLALQLQALD